MKKMKNLWSVWRTKDEKDQKPDQRREAVVAQEQQPKEVAMVIAMKGYPCTGKTTVARALASSLNYPLINQYDVLPSLKQSAMVTSTTSETVLIDLSFQTLCQIALTQLRLGMGVIINSPLSHRSHLDQLVQLADLRAARLIIVECKPQDKYEWRLRFHRHQKLEDPTQYPKPLLTWEELQKSLKGFDDYDVGKVPKLMVDTTKLFGVGDLVMSVLHIARSRPPLRVTLHEWIDEVSKSSLSKRLELRQFKKKVLKQPYNKHLHAFSFSSNGVDQSSSSTCILCQDLVSGPFYRCVDCEFVLHKWCAEKPDNDVEVLRQTCPIWLRETPPKYEFSDMERCNSCVSFSYKSCSDCLFLTHLKCGLLPSVLNHEGHEHPLGYVITPHSYNHQYECGACGNMGMSSSYRCLHGCNLDFHVSCVLLSRSLEHKCHIHPLAISYNTCVLDESDEMYCDVCETTRNPKDWMYYCMECDYAAHMSCVTSEVWEKKVSSHDLIHKI